MMMADHTLPQSHTIASLRVHTYGIEQRHRYNVTTTLKSEAFHSVPRHKATQLVSKRDVFMLWACVSFVSVAHPSIRSWHSSIHRFNVVNDKKNNKPTSWLTLAFFCGEMRRMRAIEYLQLSLEMHKRNLAFAGHHHIQTIFPVS